MKKNVKKRYEKPTNLYLNVRRPNPFAKRRGKSLTKGIGRKINTPIRLNKKWAMAILIAAFELNVAAIKAVTVVPMLAPKINGTADFNFTTFFATNGTTIEVVTVLDRMAAVVNKPHANDLNVFLKKNR